MLLGLIKRSDAFFESEQRLVDFSSVHSSLLVRIDRVSPSLASCKVNEGKFAKHLLLIFLKSQLEDGMRSR